ncbi:MAG: hypothetical protein GDA53_09615 [Rhodobacteraceae bacterium]|nr:hypothetical protein [Paracoccaceae bacterium]
MPAQKFARLDPVYVPDSICYHAVTGFYADVGDIRHQHTESDRVLTPDFPTATAAPWTGRTVTLQYD